MKTGVGPHLQLSVSKSSLTHRDIDMLLSELHKTCPSDIFTDSKISGELKASVEVAVSFMPFTALRGRSIWFPASFMSLRQSRRCNKLSHCLIALASYLPITWNCPSPRSGHGPISFPHICESAPRLATLGLGSLHAL